MGQRTASGGGARYDAFISYRHAEPDRRWANWLHETLETWRTPRRLVEELGLRPRLLPVFLDEQELPASADLSGEIDAALEASRFLIVVCSPRTPASKWVNQEIVRFRELGRSERILALLVEGDPSSAFPPSLRTLRPRLDGADTSAGPIDRIEPLAADVRPPPGRTDAARTLKRMARWRLLACLLGCRFDDLRRRDEERTRRRLRQRIGGGVLVGAALLASALLALRKTDEAADARKQVHGLASWKTIRELIDRGDRLGPSGPDAVRDAKRLVESAHAAFPPAADGRVALDGVPAEFRADAEELLRPGTGALARLERRIEAAPVPPDEDARWARAIADVADPAASPVYRGLRIVRQFGLHPLGKDPASGLHEFAHLHSGALPVRGEHGRLFLADDAGIVFVLVPGGTYLRGAVRSGGENRDPDAEGEEGPVHEITVSPIFLAKHECTQAQWMRLADGANPSYFLPNVPGIQGAPGLTGRNPVETVSWDACAGPRGILPRAGLHLPSEAQWEFACRAPLRGDGSYEPRLSPWWSGPDEVQLLASERLVATADFHAWPVGGLRANRFGLFDMLGNVSELCADVRDDEAYGYLAGAPPAARLDPVAGVRPNLRDPMQRAYRGGNYSSVATAARATMRGHWGAGRTAAIMGLRPARRLDRD